MTTTEFSNEFDILYNNAMSNQAPGLDEYEKSVFLTKAQDQLVTDYFNNRVDGVGGGFDGSQKRQYDFSGIIRVKRLTSLPEYDELKKIDNRSTVYLFPSDYFLAVNEILKDSKYQYSIIPLQYNDYQRLMMKPYAFPVKKAAWRLITNKQVASVSIVDKIKDGSFMMYANTYEAGGNAVYVDTQKCVMTATLRETTAIDIITIEGSEEESQESSEVLTLNVYYIPAEGVQPTEADIKNAIKEAFQLFDEEEPEIDYTSTQKIKELENTYKQLSAGEIEQTVVEIIGRFVDNSPTYQLRYVKTLKPIILVDLDQDYNELSIKNVQKRTECELPEECHQEILERAVTLAKIAYSGSTDTIARANQRQKRNND